MNIQNQLDMAVFIRNLNKNISTEPINTSDAHSYINNFLSENLPSAIAKDKNKLTLVVNKGYVPMKIWNELESYVFSGVTIPDKFIVEDYADDVYQSYLAGSNVSKDSSYNALEITFYLYLD